MRNLGLINPATLDDFQSRILYFYLLKNKSQIYFDKNKKLKIIVNNKLYYFRLSHDIFFRKSEGGVFTERFEVKANGNEIGSGGMGRVYKIEGTLKPTKFSRLIFKKNVKRVVKEIDFNAPDAEALTVNEILLTQKILDRGVKNLVIATEQQKGLIVMHELDGRSLVDIIDDDLRGISPLTVNQRIEISIFILLALEKIHEANIIHRDVKPDNILVNATEATLFDFGLSKVKGQQVLEALGTPKYITPEQLNNCETDEKSDMFSMMVILALLWKVKLIYPDVEKLKTSYSYQVAQDQFPLEMQAYLKSCDKIKFDFSDFNTHPDLNITNSAKKNIKQLIKLTVNVNQTNRCDVDLALEIFQYIRLEKKLAGLQKPGDYIYHQFLPEVHRLAIQTRRDYKHIVNSKSPFSFSAIKTLIEKSFTHSFFINNPIMVKEFITVLNIQAFEGLHTKESILEKIDAVQADFQHTLNHLQELKDKLEALEKLSNSQPKNLIMHHWVTLLNKECTVILQKNRKYNLDIDGVVALNAKSKKALKNLKTDNLELSLILNLGCIAQEVMKNVEDKSTAAYPIKMAILTYINHTFTLKNIRKKSHAASEQRINDMYELLNIVNANDLPQQEMLQALKLRLHKIKRGVFNTNFPLFKHIGGSDLVDLVNTAIKTINHPPTHQGNIKKRRCCF